MVRARHRKHTGHPHLPPCFYDKPGWQIVPPARSFHLKLFNIKSRLFLRDIYDFIANNCPVLSSVQGLQESVHRTVVEATEARAALVRQRAGLFGVLAVVGLVLAILAPFMGAGLI